ncbi:MAG: ATP phosphoribosyltransferase regulatory subunit [Pseudomonadota bacterium]
MAADVEVVRLAADALGAIGVSELSIDLNAPPLVPALLDAFGLRGKQAAQLRAALDRKDRRRGGGGRRAGGDRARRAAGGDRSGARCAHDPDHDRAARRGAGAAHAPRGRGVGAARDRARAAPDRRSRREPRVRIS